MDNKLAAKLERHRREGVTYPNAGAAKTLGLTIEQERFALKVARHQAAKIAEDALDAATRPAPKTEAKPEQKLDDKGPVSKRG